MSDEVGARLQRALLQLQRAHTMNDEIGEMRDEVGARLQRAPLNRSDER